VESSPVDEFWGVGESGRGENQFGMLLEQIRGAIMGLPKVLKREGLPSGTSNGGHSRFAWMPVSKMASDVGLTRSAPKLVFNAFADIGLDKIFMDAVLAEKLQQYVVIDAFMAGRALDDVVRCTSDDKRIELRMAELCGQAFDRKYAGYTWYQDARSGVANWTDLFLGILARSGTGIFDGGEVLVIGAGSANEAGQVWERFGRRASLSEIGDELIHNCHREAP